MAMILLFAFLIGLFNGLRSLTAPAATAWAVYLGWMRLEPPLSFIGSLPSVVIFTIFAIGEYVVDKLPSTPSRTEPMGLIARILMGGLTGACVAAGGGQRVFWGALLGAVGGVAGCFAGYRARAHLAKATGKPTFIALLEDIVAVGGSLWIVSRL
jgi:uncharacterized membrane protein